MSFEVLDEPRMLAGRAYTGRLVLLSGKKRSGKDTAAACLTDQFGFRRFAFADPLKDAAADMLAVPRSHFENEYKDTILPDYGFTPRDFIIRLGTDFAQKVNHNFWVVNMERRLQQLVIHNPAADIVITDVRFQQELDAFKHIATDILRIERPGLPPGSTHISETDLDGRLDEMTIIKNDSTISAFYQKIKAMYDQEGKK